MIRKRKRGRKRGRIRQLSGGWTRALGFLYRRVVDGFLQSKTFGNSMARSPN